MSKKDTSGGAEKKGGGASAAFVSLREYKGKVGKLARDEFVAKYPHPILLLEKKEGDFVDPGFQTVATKPGPEDSDSDVAEIPDARRERDTVMPSGFVVETKPQLDPDFAKKVAENEAGIHVCVLQKRDPNKFASMITVGRAANNDVRINLPSVSKFHCYFTHIPKDKIWFITDANSSNGTWVDGERLKAERGRAKLSNGTAIRIGPDVVVRFFEAASFFEYMLGTVH